MDELISNRLSTLGHPQRLAVFRPVHMEAAQATIGFLLHDCCRGRPKICSPFANNATHGIPEWADHKFNVLFICTGNSARSIFAEAILRDLAPDRFNVYSAGTKPKSELNPFALEVLAQNGHDVSALRAKNIGAFRAQDAPAFDFVFTVCDQAANEDCPAWQGQTISAHWGLTDPVNVQGTDAERNLAFHQTYGALRNRLVGFTALPIASLDRISLQKAVDDLGQINDKG